MFKLISILFFTLFLSACSHSNDFNTFCKFVTELESSNGFTENNFTKNYSILFNHIDKTNYQDELKQIFSLSVQANPEEKYSLFKEAVEITIKQDWDCLPLKRFYFSP